MWNLQGFGLRMYYRRLIMNRALQYVLQKWNRGHEGISGLPFSCYEWRSVNPNQGLPMLQAILPLTFVSGAIGEDLRVCWSKGCNLLRSRCRVWRLGCKEHQTLKLKPESSSWFRTLWGFLACIWNLNSLTRTANFKLRRLALAAVTWRFC